MKSVSSLVKSRAGWLLNRNKISTSTTASGATIFYTTNGTSAPTHTGSSPGANTYVYTGPVTVGKCNSVFFKALAWKSGMSDSNVTTYDADYTPLPQCEGGGGGGMSMSSSQSTTVVFSVWDGDWAMSRKMKVER